MIGIKNMRDTVFSHSDAIIFNSILVFLKVSNLKSKLAISMALKSITSIR